MFVKRSLAHADNEEKSVRGPSPTKISKLEMLPGNLTLCTKLV